MRGEREVHTQSDGRVIQATPWVKDVRKGKCGRRKRVREKVNVNDKKREKMK